jgi:hypothetical protein
MKAFAAALVPLYLSAIFAASAMADEIDIRTFQVILSHEEPDRRQVGALRFRGGLDLHSKDDRFGGLSGLDISPDGRRLIAITDRGTWFTGRLIYDSTGQLSGISETNMQPAIGANGSPLTGRASTDSESLARLNDGSLIVGFEQRHRLSRFTAPGAPAQPVGAPQALGASPPNGGAEAVTRLWGNELLVLSERLEAGPGIAAGWVGANRTWRAVGLRKTGLFRPVGAATRDDGTIFLLERRFTALGGIADRISRVPPGTIAPGGVFKGVELGELSAPLVADNFEGIAVRRGAPGETLIYIISDDNFHSLQRTLLLMFSLAE